MRKVAISGIGIVSEKGKTVKEIWENIQNDRKDAKTEIDFSSLNLKKIRRMSKDAKFLVLATSDCIKDSKIPEEKLNDCGIMVNVLYGPSSTTLRFSSFIHRDEPNMASPIDFANTVLNASVGHTAQYFGLRGPSTLIMGSNILGYVSNYMNQRSSKELNIVVGGVEEKEETISTYAAQMYGPSFNEDGAVTLMLSNSLEQKYAYIKGVGESGLPNNYLRINSQTAGDRIPASIEKVISKALKNAEVSADEIDAVFYASPSGYTLCNHEEEAIGHLFPKEVDTFRIKDYIGEMVAGSTILGAGLAAYTVKEKIYKNVLVLGYEMSETIEAVVVGD